jgi:phosphate transport system permease protein
MSSTQAASGAAPALMRLRTWDRAFRWLTFSSAAAVLALLGSVIVVLIYGATPALKTFGIEFLFDESWNPVTEKFGALAPIYGTVVVALIAMAVAVPIGLGIAVFLSELCPARLRSPIGIAIELLAGIPSIIYGIWGLFVFAPFLQATLQPALIATFADVPLLSSLFGGPPNSDDSHGTSANIVMSAGCKVACRNGANTNRPQMP